LQRYFSIAKKYLAPESSAAASPMSCRPLSGFRRLINLSTPSKNNASVWLASWKRRSKHDLMYRFLHTSRRSVANMASYAISSSLILVINDNMINATNHIV
jgi:hypothetical protein